jgi:transposase
VDRDSLALLLAKGLSLAEIGRRFGREESTVGYWVKKHGLVAVNTEKHAARGGLRREALAELVEEGLSQRQVAERLGCSQATVRYWLRRWNLRTRPTDGIAQARSGRSAGRIVLDRSCKTHGVTKFVLDRDGMYRCRACRVVAVSARRRRVKEILVAEAGGRCVICGYDRSVAALEFHHRNPETKRFGLGQSGLTRSLDSMRAEAGKCDLLCSNCHAEVEAGITAPP